MDVRSKLLEALGDDAVRATDDGRPVVAPATEEQAIEVVRLASEHGLRARLCGNRTLLDPTTPSDFFLSSARLTGVTDYEPGDGTFTAHCGTPWSELREVTRGGGHHLSPDVGTERATLGGVLGAARIGRDRQRYGPTRDQVLGMRVLLADGTVAKSGGQLVKNVTGYDLHKLYTGSRGSLCFFLQASLRLWPLPAERRVLERAFPEFEPALEAAVALGRLPLRLETLALRRAEGGWALTLALAGGESVLRHEEAILRDTLDGLEAVPEADVALAGLRACHEPARTHAWIACLPSQVSGLAARLREQVTLVHPTISTLLVEADSRAELEPSLNASLATEGPRPTARVFPCGPTVARPDAPGAAWMERLRADLDPASLFAESAS